MNFIADASVAFKWCLPGAGETLVPQARELLTAYGRKQVQLLVPDLFWIEVANALWKAVRRARITSDQAHSALSAVCDLAIPTVPTFSLVPQALSIAMAHDRTLYDSVYLVLARISGAELITADERLVNAIAGRFPVKWLGAF